jgi:hypothetical protein
MRQQNADFENGITGIRHRHYKREELHWDGKIKNEDRRTNFSVFSLEGKNVE